MNRDKAANEIKTINEQEKARGVFSGDLTPRLNIRDLMLNKQYRMRILPSHPTKNPDGYVYIPRVEIHGDRPVSGPYGNAPTKKTNTLHRDGFDDPKAPLNYLEKFINAFLDYQDQNGEVTFSSNEEKVLFWRSLNAASRPGWKSWEYPVIVWATCNETKNENGRKIYSDYRPSMKNADAMLRIFSFDKPYIQQQIITLEEQVRTPMNEDDTRDLSEFELNSATHGFELQVEKQPDGKKDYPKYAITLYEGRKENKPLSDKFLDEFGPDSDKYPDLKAVVKSNMKSNEDLEKAVKESWWGNMILNLEGFSVH